MSSTNSNPSIGGGAAPPSIGGGAAPPSIGGGAAPPQVPDAFRCPIGGNIMLNPVVDPTDGQTYDRDNIVRWLTQHPTSPQSRRPLTVAMLKPNSALKSMIDAARASGMADSPAPDAVAPVTPVSFFASGAPPPLRLAPVSFFAQAGGGGGGGGGGGAPIAVEPLPAPDIPTPVVLVTRVPGTNLYHVTVTVSDMGRDNTLPLAVVGTIDISGSMSECAVDTERYGEEQTATMSREDLVAHAMLVSAEGASNRVTLGMALFDDTATNVMTMTQMSTHNKGIARAAIRKIGPRGGTNIWMGLKMSLLKVVEQAHEDRDAGIKRKYTIMLQTDGKSEQPPIEGGIVGAFEKFKREHRDIDVTVHTIGFGFGNNLDTALLQKLAEAGKGMCLYISDGAMVITTVSHLMANSMCVTHSNVRFHIPETGKVVELGDLLCGQTRSTIIEVPSPNFTLALTDGTGAALAEQAIVAATVPDATVEAEVTYIRMGLVGAITAALTAARHGDFALATRTIDAWHTRASYSTASTHPLVVAMLTDVKHADVTKGQVRLAVTCSDNFVRWGQHFLPQALSQYTYERATNFKDAYSEALRTGTMKAIHDDLVRTGLGLPPPVGSLTSRASAAARTAAAYHATPDAIAHAVDAGMSPGLYNAGGGCWAPGTLVLMGDSVTQKPIEDIRRGDLVWTPAGPTTVEYAIQMNRNAPTQAMCTLANGLLITPWHPVRMDGSNSWSLPADHAPVVDMDVRTVYNLLLTHAHVVNVNGVWSCTLGHGMEGPITGHPFFGNKERILAALSAQPGFAEGRPVFANLVAIKDALTGLITGWVDDVEPAAALPPPPLPLALPALPLAPPALPLAGLVASVEDHGDSPPATPMVGAVPDECPCQHLDPDVPLPSAYVSGGRWICAGCGADNGPEDPPTPLVDPLHQAPALVYAQPPPPLALGQPPIAPSQAMDVSPPAVPVETPPVPESST